MYVFPPCSKIFCNLHEVEGSFACQKKMESNFGETYEAPQDVHELEETLSVNIYEDPSYVAVFYSILSHVSSLKKILIT